MGQDALHMGLNLARFQSALQQRLNARLADFHGLDVSTILLLQALQAAPGETTLRKLACALYCSPADALRQLLPLEKIGLVERSGGHIALRAAGQQLLAESLQTAEAFYSQALAGLQAQVDGGALDAVLQAQLQQLPEKAAA